MRKNRDRLSIIAAILEAANSGSNKTRIMFNANLSSKLLEKYLTLVLALGLVSSYERTYRLTGLGKDFLKRYKAYDFKFSEVKIVLDQLSVERETLNKLCDGKFSLLSESSLGAV